ncbi:hypothetical protein [Maribacter hydrothermalis]|uniref:Methyltransferase domain-containing protein n=1 Tax=Maribacter hydrothermalis TaxID=1836467 RepID=A0A1B7YZI1_9FLAO|nr:hypothetical protein [Maribacter hydrothermalis]APQ16123.1 hypothetical protein BTR34_01620 [Maribacter hydrothermalis]OBR35700.1 hypothetical protein A9200_10895 [Maribacter hydrothermalis]
MKRIQLFEFEDFNWFPKTIRSGMTNLIVVLHKMMGTKEVIANLLLDCRKAYPFSKIVDMGSGSGGIIPDAVDILNAQNIENPIALLLTDLHPNTEMIEHIKNSGHKNVTYSSIPLDATNLTEAPSGLKTMLNSFHHMPPKKAKAILKTAQDNQQPILIYEMAQNTIPLILWWVLLPLSLVILFIMALLLTPFSKPLTGKQLLFTYIIPIIPICYAWDGQASMPRTYTSKDIELMLKEIKNENYKWKISPAKKANGKSSGYYILGLPK